MEYFTARLSDEGVIESRRRGCGQGRWSFCALRHLLESRCGNGSSTRACHLRAHLTLYNNTSWVCAGTHTLGAADARGFTVREINLRDDRDSRTDLPAEVRFVGRFS